MIPSFSWFTVYPSGRLQRVVLEGATSSPCQVPSGVHQESILGPLSFVPLSSNAKLTLYADDIVVYKPINSKQDVHAFQDNINSISKWTRDHSLTLNSAKTSLLPITIPPSPPSPSHCWQLPNQCSQLNQIPGCHHQLQLILVNPYPKHHQSYQVPTRFPSP